MLIKTTAATLLQNVACQSITKHSLRLNARYIVILRCLMPDNFASQVNLAKQFYKQINELDQHTMNYHPQRLVHS
jgi:hypothetical protein